MKRFHTEGSTYRAEMLPNGFIRVDDQRSGLVTLLECDGSVRSGVRLSRGLVSEIMSVRIWSA